MSSDSVVGCRGRVLCCPIEVEEIHARPRSNVGLLECKGRYSNPRRGLIRVGGEKQR